MFIAIFEVKDLPCLVGPTCITESRGSSNLHETAAQIFKRSISARACPSMGSANSRILSEIGLCWNTQLTTPVLEEYPQNIEGSNLLKSLIFGFFRLFCITIRTKSKDRLSDSRENCTHGD